VATADCTDCHVSHSVYSHNSTNNESVVTINFGPAPRLDNVTAAQQLGFVFQGSTVFRTICKSGVPTSNNYMSCIDNWAYCHSSPSFTTFSWDGRAYGDLFFTIPDGVSGLRLKLQRTNYDGNSNGDSFVSLNGVTIWTSRSCSRCPVIVTATVEPGDTLWLREWDDCVALFWLELWQHTRWPTEVLGSMSPTDVYVTNRLCSECPPGYSGPTCLPTPVDSPTPTPTMPPPPATSKEVRFCVIVCVCV
jgi:hypothetical protein